MRKDAKLFLENRERQAKKDAEEAGKKKIEEANEKAAKAQQELTETKRKMEVSS